MLITETKTYEIPAHIEKHEFYYVVVYTYVGSIKEQYGSDIPLETSVPNFLENHKWPKGAHALSIVKRATKTVEGKEPIKVWGVEKDSFCKTYYLTACVKDREFAKSYPIVYTNMVNNGWDYIAAHGGAYPIEGKKDVDWFLLD